MKEYEEIVASQSLLQAMPEGQLTNTVRIRIGKSISELSNGIRQFQKGLLHLTEVHKRL